MSDKNSYSIHVYPTSFATDSIKTSIYYSGACKGHAFERGNVWMDAETWTANGLIENVTARALYIIHGNAKC